MVSEIPIPLPVHTWKTAGMEPREASPRLEAAENPGGGPNRLISILLPFFNEERYLGEVMARLAGMALPPGTELEIIAVDDGSTDGSIQVLEAARRAYALPCKLLVHPRNLGKGAAIETAFTHSRGCPCVIQDSDLEYHPEDIPRLIQPILSGNADVVFGSRFLPGPGPRVVGMYSMHVVNRLLTRLSNLLTNLNLSDMETGYKVFKRASVEGMRFRERGFGLEPELTVKFAGKRLKIMEVPISYAPRSFAEGKKIRWTDGLRALWCLIRYRFAA